MKNLITFTLLLLLAISQLKSQEVLANSGGEGSTSEVSVNWTLGEPITETISNENNVLTQGFQQSKLIITLVDESNVDDLDIKVFPNPTTMYLSIESPISSDDYSIQLLDGSGKLLPITIGAEQQASGSTKLNLQSLEPAIYYLKIIKQKQTKTFKIIKK